jgi:hypothetical protein
VKLNSLTETLNIPALLRSLSGFHNKLYNNAPYLGSKFTPPETKLSPQHGNSVNHRSEADITPIYNIAAVSTAVIVNRENTVKKRAVPTNQAHYKPQMVSTLSLYR